MKSVMIKSIFVIALVVMALSCGPEFDQASRISSQRFIGIIADPIEAAPGEQINFTAVVVNKDGSTYTGPVAWYVIGDDAFRLEGEGDLDPAYGGLSQTAQTPWTFTLPSKDKLSEDFGGWERKGLLLTVAAISFKGGDVNGEPITAFKLFIASDRSEDQRMTNPVIEDVIVNDRNGQAMQQGDDDYFVTDTNKVYLRAVPENPSNRYSFHWFANSGQFEPDFDDAQAFKPGGLGDYHVHCVLRQSYFFEHDDGTSTRITGQNWRQVDIRLE